MSDSSSPLKRDGTMQVTAKEGIEYLEASAAGDDYMRKLYGLKPDPSKLQTTGTMAATAKEGEELLADSGVSPDAQTRSQQKELDAQKESPQKHKLSKDTTMVATAKEGERILADSKIDADAHTRSQQRNLDSIKDEDEPSEKKVKMSKEGTMAVTAKEGQELLGKEAIGETRSGTRQIAEANQNGTDLKRDSTIDKTVADAQHVLEGVDPDAKTRSQAADSNSTEASPLKRDGTMQQTVKEGEEYINRASGDASA